jgi:signal transduction histidine kinase
MTMWIIVSNRAQRLAQLQMGFVSAVSHELRTPLTIIASAADNISQGIVHEPQQLAQYGAVIGNQARRLSALVEQVLLFASTREANRPYTLRPVDIAEVIDSACRSS